MEGDNGRIEHSELTYGEGLIMVGQETTDSERPWKRSMRSPQSLNGLNTQCVMFFVDDAEAHCAHARSHTARAIVESPQPTTTARITGQIEATEHSIRKGIYGG